MLLKKNKTSLLLVVALCATTLIGHLVFYAPSVSAAIEEPCPDGFVVRFNPGQDGPTYSELCEQHQTGTSQSDDTEASTTNRVDLEADCKTDEGEALTPENCGIVGYLLTFTNALSAIVGIVIVIMIAVGGIQYTTARDDPQAVSAARNRIRNAIFALVIYLFGFAFLQYIVPGGIL